MPVNVLLRVNPTAETLSRNKLPSILCCHGAFNGRLFSANGMRRGSVLS
jgi:hypothetical protein